MSSFRRVLGCNCATCQPEASPAARLIFNLPGGLVVGFGITAIMRIFL
ncbi:hypothetical protein [uncultured Sphingomonas sp.]|nr:hypothetical protein [uncultured Sphingomonas sp.]